ncbi:MAG: hypothetical protein V3S30_03555 [Thermoanaerobaculia bacterium]
MRAFEYRLRPAPTTAAGPILPLLCGLILLAASAFAVAPNSVASPLWLDANGEPLPFASEDEILDYLRSARIVDRKRIDAGINRPYKMTLERNGITAHAVFRTVDRVLNKSRKAKTPFEIDRDSYKLEVAAYKFSRLVGLPRVPPVVLRRIRGQNGSLQLWVENAITEATLLTEQRDRDQTRTRLLQRQTMIAFDNLIYNFDRHLGNVLYDRAGRLWYIDHTRSFRGRAELATPDKIQLCDRRLLDRLRHLKDHEVFDVLRPFLNGWEMRTLIRRRDLLVEWCDRRIADHGADLILFDFEATLASRPEESELRLSKG